jgi:hypothetical protein
MELDLLSLFELLCIAVLMAENPPTPTLPPLGSYTRALLVSQDRRHLFVTPWIEENLSCVSQRVEYFERLQPPDIHL